MNYYRRYVGSYQKKTMRLDPTDHGVYDLMLDYYYAEEEPLPLELDDIHSICKATKPEHKKSVTKVLGLYFRREADGYHNERADEELAVSRQARENGKTHTGKRTKTPTGGGTGNTTGEPTETGTGEATGSPTGGGTGEVTGKGGGSGHPSTYNHQPSTDTLQPPADSLQPSTPHHQGKNIGRSAPPVERLLALGVPEQAASDWLKVRKAKRAPLTQTAIEDLIREAGKAGISVGQAVEVCARRNWQGFNASWDWRGNGGGNGISKQAQLEARNAEVLANWHPPEEVR